MKTYGDKRRSKERLIQSFINCCREDDLSKGRISSKYSRTVWSELSRYVSRFVSSRPDTRELLHTLLNALFLAKLPPHLDNKVAEKRREF